MDVFVRKNGVFGGVCGGLSDKLGVNVGLIRFLMLVSAFFSFGLTFILYMAAVFAFPNAITLQFGERPVFLGVCHRLAQKIELHESWLRFLVLLAFVFTGFVPVFLVYMLLFLIVGTAPELKVVTYQRKEGSSDHVRDVN